MPEPLVRRAPDYGRVALYPDLPFEDALKKLLGPDEDDTKPAKGNDDGDRS